MISQTSINTFKITPICFTFYCKTQVPERPDFAFIIHSAFETAFADIDIENRETGTDFPLFFRHRIPENKIADVKIIRDNIENPPRGYSFSFNKTDRYGYFNVRVNFYGYFSQAIPFFTKGRLNALFNRINFHGVSFVSAKGIDNIQLPGLSTFSEKGIQSIGIDKFKSAKIKSNFLEMHFTSPVNLYKQHSHTGNFAFTDIFFHLLKRIAFLNYLYCDGEIPEIEQLKEDSRSIACQVEIEQISLSLKRSYRKDKTELKGFSGTVQYKTDKRLLNEILGLLLLGEYAQIGNQTTYGQGKYMINHNNYEFV